MMDKALYRHIADIIDDFVASMYPGYVDDKRLRDYAWDDEFISERFADPFLERASKEAAEITSRHDHYREEDYERLRQIARELRAAANSADE